jgi:hypothetical protein
MKVQMTKRCATWALQHPEVWIKPNGRIGDYKKFNAWMQMCWACLLDVPIYGKVDGVGSMKNVFHVTWSHRLFGEEGAYYEKGKDYTEV